LVFDSLQLTPDMVTRVVIDWRKLFSPDPPDAAMVSVGRGSPLVSNLLSDGGWRLVPVPDPIQLSLQHPTLRPMTIEPSEFAAVGDGHTQAISASIPTVGTTAFMTAREDTPSKLVVAVLDALYAHPAPCVDLIPRQRAAEWQGLVFHPAARRYFLQLHSQ
jgi:hypothetical protein